MGNPIYTRETPGFRTRVMRFRQKHGSVGAIAHDLAEHALVRLMDHSALRQFYARMVSQKEPEKWLFLVGCYNSGTTLLQKILSAHPQIAGMPREGVRFTEHLSNLELNGHHMFWDKDWRKHSHPDEADSAQKAKLIKRDWSPFWKSGALVYMDKSIANTARIEWLDQHFKNAHFIGIHRNGYCVAEGLHRRSRPPAWLKRETGKDHYPLIMAGQQWVTSNATMIEGFQAVSKKQIISFEELVDRPADVLERIFEFCGVKTIQIESVADGIRIDDKSFKIYNPNAESFGRLGPKGKLELDETVKPMMEKLGYLN